MNCNEAIRICSLTHALMSLRPLPHAMHTIVASPSLFVAIQRVQEFNMHVKVGQLHTLYTGILRLTLAANSITIHSDSDNPRISASFH